VPDVLPRLVYLGKLLRKYSGQDDEHDTFVWLEDVIADNLDLLFPGMRVIEHHPFRVIRNADIDYDTSARMHCSTSAPSSGKRASGAFAPLCAQR
jgi:polyphosphate kinase